MASEGDASGLSSKTPLLASHEHGSLGLEDDHARRANRMQCLTTTAPGRKAGFDRVFLRRLGLLVRVGFNHSCCSRMAWRAYLNWVLTLIAALLMFSTKLVIGPFIQAIVEEDTAAVLKWTGIGCGVFTLCTLLIVCNQWIGEKLALDWRKNLVRALHQRYLDKDCLFYALNNVDGRVDNADQRLTQDVNQVTILAGRLAFGNYQVNESVPFLILQSIASIVFVSAQVSWFPVVCGVGYFLLSSMCPQRLLVAGCPLTLLLVAVAVMTCLIVPVARLTYVVNQAEGSYRFLHARIKEFSEAVTLYGGQTQEQLNSSRHFSYCCLRPSWQK